MPSIQINIGDHISTQAGWIAIPVKHRPATSWARVRAKRIAREMPSADAYFQTLPLGRSLTALLSDNTIWINYDPVPGAYGRTNFAGGREIGIGDQSYNAGRWTVLATLIHELAHVNGVRGRISPRAAEDALLHCGLGNRNERKTGVDDPKTPYDPSIRG